MSKIPIDDWAFVLAILFGLFILTLVLNNGIFGEAHAETFCGGEVYWSNPSVFRCGEVSDFLELRTYYELGLFPPFSIKNFDEWNWARRPISKRWGGR